MPKRKNQSVVDYRSLRPQPLPTPLVLTSEMTKKHVDTKKAKKKEALLSSASFIEIKSQQDATELTVLASKKAKRDSAASTSNDYLHTSKASSDSTVVKSLNHIMLQLADIKHLIMSTQPQNNKYPEEIQLLLMQSKGCGQQADKLASAEFTAKNAPKLALNLMRALFSDDELVNGCCTPSPSGYKILDQTIIGGIRMHINLPVAWMTKRYDGSQYYKAI
ncbi:hypothetical protein EMCRGX_G010709 [Ephydatia muelleri]